MAVVRQWGVSDSAIARLTKAMTAATDGEMKLVIDDGREMIFDLTTDPLEESPLESSTLSRDQTVRLNELRRAAEEAAVATEPVKPSSPTVGPESADDDTAEIEAQMKLLGYM
jgi:hypothetical protein